MKTLVKVLLTFAALSVLVIIVWQVAQVWQEKRLAERLTAVDNPRLAAGRKLFALEITDRALAAQPSPNVYAFLTSADLEAGILRAWRSSPAPKADGFKQLTVLPRSVKLETGVIVLTAELEGELEQPIGFVGELTVVCAPAFDGASVALVPLQALLNFKRLRAYGIEDTQHLTGLLNAVLAPVSTFVVSSIERVSLPVNLSHSDEVDVKALLESGDGVEADAPRARLRVALKRAAVLCRPEGLHLAATGLAVAPQEYDIAIEALRSLREQLKNLPPPPACEPCSLKILEIKKYADCLDEYLHCRAGSALRLEGQVDSILTPVQMLALTEASISDDPDLRQLATDLAPLRAPFIRPGRISERAVEEVATAANGLLERMRVAREQVQAGVADPESRSWVSIRREVIAECVNYILSAGRITVKVSAPPTAEHFNETLRTGAPPDLRCDEGLPQCDEPFSYPGWPEPPCPSDDCRTENCHDTFLGRICLPGVDLGCLGRKADCETRKEADRLAYEAAKGVARAGHEAKLVGCRTERELKRAGCKINQEWLNTTGDLEIGRVEGTAHFDETSVSILGTNVSVAPMLGSITAVGTVSGSARVSTELIYTPLNAGHLICVAQWGGTLIATVAIAPTERTIVAQLDEDGSRTANALLYRTEEQEIVLTIDPPPGLALLTQNPHAFIVCPLPAALVGSLPSPVNYLVGLKLLLHNEIKQKAPSRDFRIPLPIAALPGFDSRVRLGSTSVLMELSPVNR